MLRVRLTEEILAGLIEGEGLSICLQVGDSVKGAMLKRLARAKYHQARQRRSIGSPVRLETAMMQWARDHVVGRVP